MKRIIITSIVISMILSLGLAFAVKPDPDKKGNGLPKGKSYNFNLIGVPDNNRQWDDDSGGQGKRIFISRTGMTQFYVYGDDDTSYEILDRNGIDGKVGTGPGLEGAGITLPYDETQQRWTCSIWVRLLGPQDPDNKIDGVTKYDYSGGTWLQQQTWTFTREKTSKFRVKTGDLLVDGYQNILWEMTPGDKFRIAQFRVIVEE